MHEALVLLIRAICPICQRILATVILYCFADTVKDAGGLVTTFLKLVMVLYFLLSLQSPKPTYPHLLDFVNCCETFSLCFPLQKHCLQCFFNQYLNRGTCCLLKACFVLSDLFFTTETLSHFKLNYKCFLSYKSFLLSDDGSFIAAHSCLHALKWRDIAAWIIKIKPIQSLVKYCSTAPKDMPATTLIFCAHCCLQFHQDRVIKMRSQY